MPIVVLPNVRLQYGDLHRRGKPSKDKPNEPGKYAANGIMDETSEAYKIAFAAFETAAKEKFGQNWQAIVGAMERGSKCIRKGDFNLAKDGSIRPGFAGKMYVVAKNHQKPAIVDRYKVDGQFVTLTEESGLPFNGCYVDLKVDIYALPAQGEVKAGVFAKLLAVRFLEKAEAFGSTPPTADGFADEGEAPAGSATAPASGSDLF